MLVAINSVNVSGMRIDTDDILNGQMLRLSSVLLNRSALVSQHCVIFRNVTPTLNEEVLQIVYDCFDHHIDKALSIEL